jgi:hypothetical protein
MTKWIYVDCIHQYNAMYRYKIEHSARTETCSVHCDRLINVLMC